MSVKQYVTPHSFLSAHFESELLRLFLGIDFLDHRAKSLQLLLKMLIASLDITDLINGRISFRCQPRNDQADDAVGPLVHRHVLADLFLVFSGDLLVETITYDAANAELGDGEKVEKLADDLRCRGDLRAEVIDEQTPRDEAQQQKQQTGPEGVGHIQ